MTDANMEIAFNPPIVAGSAPKTTAKYLGSKKYAEKAKPKDAVATSKIKNREVNRRVVGCEGA